MARMTATAPSPSAAAILRTRIAPGRPRPGLTAEIAVCRCSEPARAGLYLLNGDWDAAHRTAQEIDSPLGAHWHALVHRQEPDLPNSKYWLARVGPSPIYPRLAEAARAAGHGELLRDGKWDAVRFTDCLSDPRNASWTGPLDALEREELLDHCMAMEIPERHAR